MSRRSDGGAAGDFFYIQLPNVLNINYRYRFIDTAQSLRHPAKPSPAALSSAFGTSLTFRAFNLSISLVKIRTRTGGLRLWR